MKLISLEYVFHTTPKILFKQISTPSGLPGWFAQDVDVDGNIYIFKWGDYRMDAVVTIIPENFHIKINWIDEEEKKTEIKLNYNKLSKDTSMIITDIAEDEQDAQDLQKLWDEAIKRLKLRLGLPPKLLK